MRKLRYSSVLSFGNGTDTGRISMLVTALAEHHVDIKDLPIAVTALEWMEQATIEHLQWHMGIHPSGTNTF